MDACGLCEQVGDVADAAAAAEDDLRQYIASSSDTNGCQQFTAAETLSHSLQLVNGKNTASRR